MHVDAVVPARTGTASGNQSGDARQQNRPRPNGAAVNIPTAAELVRAVRAVSLFVAHKFLGNAAAPVGTAELTALGRPSTVDLVGLVPTLRPAVTHLGLGDAHLPIRALKFT